MLSRPRKKQQTEAEAKVDWQLALLMIFVSTSGSKVGGTKRPRHLSKEWKNAAAASLNTAKAGLVRQHMQQPTIITINFKVKFHPSQDCGHLDFMLVSVDFNNYPFKKAEKRPLKLFKSLHQLILFFTVHTYSQYAQTTDFLLKYTLFISVLTYNLSVKMCIGLCAMSSSLKRSLFRAKCSKS